MKKIFTKDKWSYWLLFVLGAVTVIAISFAVLWHYKYVSTVDEMNQRIQEMTQTITDYQNDNMQLTDANDSLQSELDSYNDQIAEAQKMKSKYTSLEEKNTQLQQDNSDLKGEVEELQKQVDELEETADNVSASLGGYGAADDTQDSYSGTVYWTPGGEVYHSTADCPSLGRSSTIYYGTISQSGKSRGCKICY